MQLFSIIVNQIININVIKNFYTNINNSVALSPQANYTDQATATCTRNLVPTFEDRGVLRHEYI
jgi:hypothetical protein